MSGPTLSGVQLRRAIENSGGLWTSGELRKLDVLREGDLLRDLPAGIYIDRITYRCGYDMLDYAETAGRAHSAQQLLSAIEERLGKTRRHYADTSKKKSYRRVGIQKHGGQASDEV